jgi:GNAT superfamily N-acetyltransferase
MLIVPFETKHQTHLVQAWNSWLPARFHLDSRLLEQLTIHHPSWDRFHCHLAWDGEQLIGFLLARPGHLDAVAVTPERRRQGIGRNLIQKVAAERFGGGPAHFIPGVPEGWKEAEGFLESVGFSSDWWAEDLHMTLSSRDSTFTSCDLEDQESVVGMVGEEFSKRWTDDTRARFEHGDHRDVVIIRDEDGPVAFCQTWHFESRLLGPSTFWLRNSCPKFGGIGPVGVRERARGLGLGGRIVVEALNYLAHRGVQEVVVDWTAIGDFYKKYGFASWQRYRGYSRNG